MHYLARIFVFLLISTQIFGQNAFSEFGDAFLLFPSIEGVPEFGDFDDDGDLDLLLTGPIVGDIPYARIYRNDLNVQFSEVFSNESTIASNIGDYDNDNDLDILLCTKELDPSSPSGYWTKLRIFQNDGNFTFTEIPISFEFMPGFITDYLPGVEGVIDWRDYDLDGDLDVFVSGTISYALGRRNMFYVNDGNNHFSQVRVNNISNDAIRLSFGDYNLDGYTDIITVDLDGISVYQMCGVRPIRFI
jgi:hypothetical protein